MRAWGRQLSAQLLCSLAVTVPELTEVGSVPPCPSLTLQVPIVLFLPTSPASSCICSSISYS